MPSARPVPRLPVWTVVVVAAVVVGVVAVLAALVPGMDGITTFARTSFSRVPQSYTELRLVLDRSGQPWPTCASPGDSAQVRFALRSHGDQASPRLRYDVVTTAQGPFAGSSSPPARGTARAVPDGRWHTRTVRVSTPATAAYRVVVRLRPAGRKAQHLVVHCRQSGEQGEQQGDPSGGGR